MTISMDKKYRTRDGRDVRLLCVDGPGEYPVLGFLPHATSPMQWTSEGASRHGWGGSDLIECHEPDIRTIWVNVYPECAIPYADEVSAKRLATRNAIVIAQPVTFEVKRNA